MSFITADYITGVIKAFINKNLNSEIGAKGLLKKCLIFIVLFVSVLLDTCLYPDKCILRDIVCYYYIINEALSILENVGQMGVPLPKKLLEALEKLKNDKEKDDND